MFENLTQRLSGIVHNLRGQGRLSETNIQASLREVRVALLEADVALPVVKVFIERVRARAVGVEVLQSLTPGQALIKVVSDALTELMGERNEALSLKAAPPAVILLAGLQGSGKTTTTAKLARLLQQNHGKSVAVCSCDIYRPAAREQLQMLAAQLDIAYLGATAQQPVAIATRAQAEAAKQHTDVLLVDTAGRLHIDQAMMDEVQQLHAALMPVETLFVVDAMTGQDAAASAQAFAAALPLTGVILTKLDGDARGGAALSVREVTGKPIKFCGTGEKLDALEAFHPERMASRILGMGDVLSLVETAQQQVDHQQAQKLARKLNKGKAFDLIDLRDQLQQMQSMGGMASLLDKLPGMGNIPTAARAQADDAQLTRMVAIIDSMTLQERRHPAIIKGSRKRRIAAGSGTQVQEVNRLLKQHLQMSKMMKKAGKGNLQKMMRGLKGRLPPGMGI